MPWCTDCYEEGSQDNPLTADHVVSLAEGGDPWALSNLTTRCRRCNGRKGASSA